MPTERNYPNYSQTTEQNETHIRLIRDTHQQQNPKLKKFLEPETESTSVNQPSRLQQDIRTHHRHRGVRKPVICSI
jgi:hypothetical protein